MHWLIGIGIIIIGFIITSGCGTLFGRAWKTVRGQQAPFGFISSPSRAITLTILAAIGFIGGIGVILGGVGYTLFSLMDDNSKPVEIIPCDNNRDVMKAWELAQIPITKSLKSPSTAEFPEYSPEQVKQNNCLYYVVSHVDAQNSFGAKLRNNFTVLMEKNPTTYEWNFVDVKMMQP